MGKCNTAAMAMLWQLVGEINSPSLLNANTIAMEIWKCTLSTQNIPPPPLKIHFKKINWAELLPEGPAWCFTGECLLLMITGILHFEFAKPDGAAMSIASCLAPGPAISWQAHFLWQLSMTLETGNLLHSKQTFPTKVRHRRLTPCYQSDNSVRLFFLRNLINQSNCSLFSPWGNPGE